MPRKAKTQASKRPQTRQRRRKAQTSVRKNPVRPIRRPARSDSKPPSLEDLIETKREIDKISVRIQT